MGDGAGRRRAGQNRQRPTFGRAPASERLYDAFVVRLWRDGASGRLLRAEVEHATSGERTRATDPADTWVLDQIRACLDAAAPLDPSDPVAVVDGVHNVVPR